MQKRFWKGFSPRKIVTFIKTWTTRESNFSDEWTIFLVHLLRNTNIQRVEKEEVSLICHFSVIVWTQNFVTLPISKSLTRSFPTIFRKKILASKFIDQLYLHVPCRINFTSLYTYFTLHDYDHMSYVTRYMSAVINTACLLYYFDRIKCTSLVASTKERSWYFYSKFANNNVTSDRNVYNY